MGKKKKLTAGPDLIRVRATVLPPAEQALHVAVEIVLRGVDELRVVDVPVPLVQVAVVVALRAADDDAAVAPGDEIVVLAGPEAEHVAVRQQRRVRLRGHDATADAAHGVDFVPEFGEEVRGVGVAGVDDFGGAEAAARRRDVPRLVRGGPDGVHGRVGLEVDSLCDGVAEEVGDEFVRPHVRGRVCEAALDSFDAGDLEPWSQPVRDGRGRDTYAFGTLAVAVEDVFGGGDVRFPERVEAAFQFLVGVFIHAYVGGSRENEVAVDIFFLHQVLDRLDLTSLERSRFFGDFATV
jgi:hypothetical protein